MYSILMEVFKFQLRNAIKQHKVANLVCFTTRFLIQEPKEDSYSLKT